MVLLPRARARLDPIDPVVQYLSEVIDNMNSSWESILTELDAKLAAFSSTNPDDDVEPVSLEHQFMSLLIRGIPSMVRLYRPFRASSRWRSRP